MKFILFISILTVVSATQLRSKRLSTISCKEMEHARCLKWNNNTQNCYVLDCWAYDTIGGCTPAGKPFVPAIVLQSIPFTGVFGSGFGNIGRWDIFSVYMAVVFGPPALALIIMCCVTFCNDDKDDEERDEALVCITISSSCFGCLWGITLLVFYIWGIVTIASKDVDAPWTSSNGTEIMCPMV
tara:strand:- start:1022 stop:1573 length:552 start_codon:yes stop_codon:yes gene_type:complete